MSSADRDHLDTLRKALHGYALPSVCILGIITNCASIPVLRKLRSSASRLLVALAISDSICLLLLAILYSLLQFILCPTGCQAALPLNVIYLTSQTVNIWLVVAIGVERWIAVCFPFKHRGFFTLGRTLMVIGGIMVASTAYHFPLFFARKMVTYTMKAGNETITRKRYGWTSFANNTAFQKGYFLWGGFVLNRIVPLTLLLVSTIWTVLELRAARHRLRFLQSSTNKRPEVRRRQRELTITIMLIAIIIFFIAMAMPSLAARIKFLARTSSKVTVADFELNLSAVLITAISSAANFWIYMFSNQMFRHQFNNVYRRNCEECAARPRSEGSRRRLIGSSTSSRRTTITTTLSERSGRFVVSSVEHVEEQPDSPMEDTVFLHPCRESVSAKT